MNPHVKTIAVATGSGLVLAAMTFLKRRRGLGAAFTDDEARSLIEMSKRPRKNLGTLFSGLGAIKVKARTPPPPRKGVVKLALDFDHAKEPDKALAIEWLRKNGLADKETIGEILVELRRTAEQVMKLADPENYEIGIRSWRVGAAAKPARKAGSGTGPEATLSEKGKAYYDEKAKGLSSEKVGLLFNKSKGTIDVVAKKYAENAGLPWPPPRR